MTIEPTGKCWCDCGQETQRDQAFFLVGHDKRAERQLKDLDGGKSIAERIAARFERPGEGAMRNAVLEADIGYEYCRYTMPDGTPCMTIGKGVGMRKHLRTHTGQ